MKRHSVKALPLLLALILALSLLGGCNSSAPAPQASEPTTQPAMTEHPKETATPAPATSPDTEMPAAEETDNPIPSATVKEVVVSFDFTHMSTHASNQFAVWIEDSDGDMVKTLFVPDFTAARRGYRMREDAVPSWVSAADPDAMTDQEIDAISSATPHAGSQQFAWDMTDANGNPVPDGVYRIMVEGTLYWGSTVLYTAELDTSSAAAGDLPVTELRSEPHTKENEGMIQSVHVTVMEGEAK